MNEKRIHIVALDIPYPANYGGVIDIFNRIRALNNSGIRITLHAFYSNRTEAPELKEYCDSIFYYKRKISIRNFFSFMPFIVKTRIDKKLLYNLLRDTDPILFEGLHTTAYLNHPRLKGRTKLVRMHNIEYEYYYQLAKAEKNAWRKLYNLIEGFKLKRYEKIITVADHVVTISPNDYDHYNATYPNIELIPSSHSTRKIDSLPGYGEYIFYHGKLSVPENENAVMFLLKNVFTRIKTPFIVAGMNPSNRLKRVIKKLDHVTLIADPPEEEMLNLIREAHINLIVTFQATGLKLKLLKSLYYGRFCIVNSPMVSGTGLEPLCEIADTADDLIKTIDEFMHINFSPDHIKIRHENLMLMFDPVANAKKWTSLLFPEE
ncbi:hypothetical protein [Saccharicrinis sp. FJH62]|uniref:hypothetical protein n=1 Tax=Saccharicrinis sp. FJH62 TaxID=3344657 RepID=UPI0035D51672